MDILDMLGKQLKPWEEIIGTYEALKINEDQVTVTLSHTLKNATLTFQRNSPEAQTLIQILKNTPKGTKIAVLKTNIIERPLMIRTINITAEANKAPAFRRKKCG